MTIVNQRGDERILGRRRGRLWDVVQREWAGENCVRWKQLACIHLRLHCEWPLERIGLALGHTRGHTQRLLKSGLLGLQQECFDLDVDLDAEFAADAPATAALIPSTGSELQRRIDHCRVELDLWERLRDQRKHALRLWRRERVVRMRIVPGSLRERIAEYLDESGKCRVRRIVRMVRATSENVLDRLCGCPEFVCDRCGWWSLHRFEGQEMIGIDVEEVPMAEGGAA